MPPRHDLPDRGLGISHLPDGDQQKHNDEYRDREVLVVSETNYAKCSSRRDLFDLHVAIPDRLPKTWLFGKRVVYNRKEGEQELKG